MSRTFACVLVVAGSSACRPGPGPTSAIPIEFLVESDPGVPLAGALVSIDGVLAGHSDSDGLVRTRVRARTQSTVRVEHDCPAGFLHHQTSKNVRVREYRGLNHDGAPPMQVRLLCKPEKRRAAFVVRARNGAELPVLLNGELVAKTNALGVAHFTAMHPPGTEYLVKVDTRARPKLSPSSPSHLFSLPDAHEVFAIDLSFEEGAAPRRPRAPRHRILKIE